MVGDQLRERVVRELSEEGAAWLGCRLAVECASEAVEEIVPTSDETWCPRRVVSGGQVAAEILRVILEVVAGFEVLGEHHAASVADGGELKADETLGRARTGAGELDQRGRFEPRDGRGPPWGLGRTEPSGAPDAQVEL